MRRPKKLDPKTIWVITDSDQPITPPFYREELAKAALKELSKDRENLEVQQNSAPPDVDGSFLDALHLLDKENRWLDASARDKRYFQGLCEGWLTGPRAKVSEPSQSVSQ